MYRDEITEIVSNSPLKRIEDLEEIYNTLPFNGGYIFKKVNYCTYYIEGEVTYIAILTGNRERDKEEFLNILHSLRRGKNVRISV